MTKDELAKILGKAQSLCSAEGNKKIDEYSNRFKNNSNPSPSEYDGDADRFDNLYLSEPQSVKDTPITNERISKSNLPESIKQSFIQTRINTSNSGNISVLDNIPIEKKNFRQPVLEEKTEEYPSSKISIDYSIIKAIINNCLKEFFEDANYLKAIRVKEGKIKIIDNKGNVFSAILEKTGNINDKKQAN